MKTNKKYTRKAMMKYGCSGALFASVNHELGNTNEAQNQAISVLSGGMMQAGQQCGMLWGSTLAAGKEAAQKYPDAAQATELTIATSKKLMDSYAQRTQCVNCRDFSRADFSKPLHLVRYMFFRAPACFRLAGNWMPEAIEEVQDGMQNTSIETGTEISNCASETMKKLGGSPEEIQMVAGYAGGMGLSGNGCGALAAALYKKASDKVKQDGKQDLYHDRDIKTTLTQFKAATGGELTCTKICGRKFNSLEEHSRFISEGGCGKLINLLVSA